MVRVAETIGGRYELVEVIGRGGMGVVYRGRDRVLDRTVAVKVLPAEYAENQILVERFEREARAAARLSHPNIVAVFDTGREATERYIVMEFVPGLSLAALLRQRGSLEVRETVEIAAQIADALGVAHAAGIVHRDVKPGNVMVLPSGTAKVLDFGIARAAADVALTRTTMVLGSAPYIAPEVTLGESADERSDIYSLGCVLYEMLTGRPPFTGDLPAAVMNQHAIAAPRPPRELASPVPPALDALVMRMLAKAPEDRPQRAADLGPALRAALTRPAPPPPAATPAAAVTAPAPPPPPPPTAATRMAPAAMAEATQGLAPRRSARLGWLAAIVVILAVLAGAAVALIVSSGSPRTRTGQSTPPARSSPSTQTSLTHSATTRSTTNGTTSSTTAPSTSTTSGHSSTASSSSTSAPATSTSTHP